jgi:hypothetical protein
VTVDVYRLAAGVLIAAYAVCAVPWASGRLADTLLPATRFGLDQLHRFGWMGLAALVAAIGLTRPLAASKPLTRALDQPIRLATSAYGGAMVWAGAALLFWTFRSRTLNQDGAAFQAIFEREVPGRGVFATHDEILEFAVHSAAWEAARARWGWDVPTTYQAISSVAGGVFVLLLARYARLVHPARPGILVALMLAGGYAQLFFGDVENYTLTAVAILAFFVAAERFLQRRTSVVWPSAWLAVAMMCHLLAGFLLPSLVYLWGIAHRRQDRRALVAGAAVFTAVIGATLAVAHLFWGLPIERLFDSHASGHGGNYAGVLARPTLAHLWTQLNVLLLLAPAAVFLVPVALASGEPSERRRHLAIATAGMLIFLVFWFPALGPLNDWNLFANVAIPVNLLVWTTALRAPGLAGRRVALTAAALAGGLHSLAWILGNYGES